MFQKNHKSIYSGFKTRKQISFFLSLFPHHFLSPRAPSFPHLFSHRSDQIRSPPTPANLPRPTLVLVGDGPARKPRQASRSNSPNSSLSHEPRNPLLLPARARHQANLGEHQPRTRRPRRARRPRRTPMHARCSPGYQARRSVAPTQTSRGPAHTDSGQHANLLPLSQLFGHRKPQPPPITCSTVRKYQWQAADASDV